MATPAPHFSDLANPYIRALEIYQPGKSIEEVQRTYGLSHIIKLASNENPLGPSPKAVVAMQTALETVHRYPDSALTELKEKLSDYWQIAPTQLTLGNGSDNAIAMIVHTFLPVGGEAIMSQYAFANFSITTRAFGGVPVVVPAQNWGHDLKAMASAITEKTRVIFIANPNNPTGTWVSGTALAEFLAQIPPHIIVVLDEAYYEYVDEPLYPQALKLQALHPNLIITRTFSKLYGLGGMRIGYSISHPEIADLLHRVRLPFNVSRLSMAAAIAALEDKTHMQQSLAINREGRAYLQKHLNDLKLNYILSVGNFLTVDIGQPVLPIFEQLLKEGVIVRPLVPYGMSQHLRVTIGLPEENRYFIEKLVKVLQHGNETLSD